MSRIVILRSRSTAGLEPRVERAARTLQQEGHDVRVFLWDRECAYPRREDREGVRIRRLPLPAPYNRPILLLPMLWWMMAAFLATRGAKVVHASDLDTLPVALAAKVLGGRKVVYDIFDFYGDLITRPLAERTRRALRGMEAGLASFADMVLLPDSVRRGTLGPKFPRPVEIVMNAPPDEVLSEKQPAEFTLFYGGNLGPDRGLLEASEVVSSMEDVAFRVAGAGELEKPLRSLAEASSSLEFLGQIDHPTLLRETARAHAVLAWYDPSVPANRVASPNKLFEAMMLSRPVLVSDGTNAGEITSLKKSGITVPYGDVEALRAAIVRLRDDPTHAASLGAAGRRAFESTFNWPVNEKRLREAYRAVLAESAVDATPQK